MIGLKILLIKKSDLILKKRNLINSNFSIENRLRLLGVVKVIICNFILFQALFFAQNETQIRSFKMSQTRCLNVLSCNYASLYHALFFGIFLTSSYLTLKH